MSNAKKDVATTETPFGTQMPAYMNPESNKGSEGVGMEDVALPRLSIIQDLSPQHKKNKPEYIDGAEPGMIFNTVTSDLYGKSVYIVPVYYHKEWVIWKDQDKGGGFRGAFNSETEAEKERLSLDDANDCEVVDTAQHYVLLVQQDGEDFTINEAVISMSKSQMKVNRKWNSAIRMAGGDRFSRVYEMAVVEDSNAAGQEYYNWRVKPVGFAPEKVYKAAESMYETVKAGGRTVARDEAPVTDEEDTDEM